jgi:hypothetical protein
LRSSQLFVVTVTNCSQVNSSGMTVLNVVGGPAREALPLCGQNVTRLATI